jgi:peptide/nickel transport system permease protein
MRPLLRDPLAMLGLALVLLTLLAAALAQAPQPGAAKALLPPGFGHPLAHPWGTDSQGRDLLAQVAAGARPALAEAAAVVALSLALALPAGLWLGWSDGALAGLLRRMALAAPGWPQLFLVLALLPLLPAPPWGGVLALALGAALPLVAALAAALRPLRAAPFILAWGQLGMPTARLLLRHALPHLLPLLGQRACHGMALALLATTSLGFLGLGAAAPAPGWGQALAEAWPHLPLGWWCAVFPGLALLLAALGFTLLGDGLGSLEDGPPQ